MKKQDRNVGETQDDELAIRQLVATWLSATEDGKAEQVLSLMSDDVIFLVPGLAPMGKSDFAAGQEALKASRIHAVSEIQEIQVMGEWAYCWNKLSVTITPRSGEGAAVRRAGHVLSILQKQAGAWVIVRDANMLTGTSG